MRFWPLAPIEFDVRIPIHIEDQERAASGLENQMLQNEHDAEIKPVASCCSKKQNAPVEIIAAPQRAAVIPRASMIAKYQPLIAIAALALIGGVMMAFGAQSMPFESGMRMAMGIFLLSLSLLKLFDVKGFADGFSKYDPLANKIRIYAWAYPFLEAGLALSFLTGVGLVYANFLTVFVFGLNAAGVYASLRRGEQLQCACVGAKFGIPLGRVTLVEDIAMAAMGGVSRVRAGPHGFTQLYKR